jgi:serine/threonine transporter
MPQAQVQPLLVRMMNTNIVIQILIGIVAGVALATLAPDLAVSAGLFGQLFGSGCLSDFLSIWPA